MFYMFLGALLFLWVEGASDRAQKLHQYRLYFHEKELFLKRIEEIFSDEASRKSKQRRLFFEEAIDYFHQQIDVSFSNHSDWSLTTALYYSGTLFTTIGYGDVACNTPVGRLMTVIYAIVGIPLMLITLNDLGKFLYKTINNAVRLKSRISRIFDTQRKITLQQKDLDLPQLESSRTLISTGTGAEIWTERGDNNEAKKIQFQLSVEATEESANSVKGEELTTLSMDDVEPISPGPPPRMPVLVAIAITVSWIFLCAGLFKIWEHDWTYAESCYFMFISLSTIGLGDLAVRRRDLMVLCFVFVIIGLSMVSMCINVIQGSLEDLYIKILMKLILDYQSRLDQGDDRMGASMGMMQMWGSNKTAKYLMPLLSKNKRMTAMAKVQEEAEAQGIEIPPIFSDIDEESGMPKLFTNHVEEASVAQAVEEAFHRAEADQQMQIEETPETIFSDIDVQTELEIGDDKAQQTSIAMLTNTVVATYSSNESAEEAVQCEDPFLAHCTVQCEEPILRHSTVQCEEPTLANSAVETESVETGEKGCMTFTSQTVDDDVQTEVVVSEEEVQTDVYNAVESDVQTEIHEYATQYIQTTPFPEMVDEIMQTEPTEEQKAPSRISRAKKRIEKALGRTKGLERSESTVPTLSGSVDPKEEEEDEGEAGEVEDEPSSSESLDWDPVDGMHAEKQRPVRDLTKFFEVQSQRRGFRRHARSFRTRSRTSSLTPTKF